MTKIAIRMMPFIVHEAEYKSNTLRYMRGIQCRTKVIGTIHNPSITSFLTKYILSKSKLAPISVGSLFSITPSTLASMPKADRLIQLYEIQQFILVKRSIATAKAGQVCRVLSYYFIYQDCVEPLSKALVWITDPPMKQGQGLCSFHQQMVYPFSKHVLCLLCRYIELQTTGPKGHSESMASLRTPIVSILDLMTQGQSKVKSALLELMYLPEHKDILRQLMRDIGKTMDQ